MDYVQLWSVGFREHLAECNPGLFNLFDRRMIYVPDANDKISVGFWPYDEGYTEAEHNDAMQKAIDDYLLEHPI